MTNDLENYKKYTKNVKRMLIMSGLWPKTHPKVRTTVAFLVFFSQIAMTLGVLNFCAHHITNITILTKGMSLVLSFCTTALKILIFYLYREDLNTLDNNLTASYEEDAKTPENHPRLFKNIRIYERFYHIQTFSATLTIAFYGTIPIIAWAKNGIYRRVFPIIYPFDFKPSGTMHWIVYCLELVTGYYLTTVTIGVDCGFGMYSLQMCGELRVLAVDLKNLKAGDDWKEQVKKCVRKHYMILDSKKRLEKLYGLIVIWMAVTSAVVLCSLIFQFTEALKLKSFSLGIVMVTFYMAVKFLQVFSYAWCGNAVSNESEQCQDAIYKSNWPDSDHTSFKKDILIIMAQKPIVLQVKACMLIQLNMFVTIAKTSVSYFCLLQTLNEES